MRTVYISYVTIFVRLSAPCTQTYCHMHSFRIPTHMHCFVFWCVNSTLVCFSPQCGSLSGWEHSNQTPVGERLSEMNSSAVRKRFDSELTLLQEGNHPCCSFWVAAFFFVGELQKCFEFWRFAPKIQKEINTWYNMHFLSTMCVCSISTRTLVKVYSPFFCHCISNEWKGSIFFSSPSPSANVFVTFGRCATAFTSFWWTLRSFIHFPHSPYHMISKLSVVSWSDVVPQIRLLEQVGRFFFI